MMKSAEVAALLKAFVKERPEIIATYLYGSYATNTARVHSDIDVAVLFAPTVANLLEAELKLGTALARLPKLAQVEVVALNRAKPRLKAEVLKTGQRVACRDHELRAAFEFEAMREWWDLGPWHETYDNEYFAAVKERFTDDERRAYQRARQTLAVAP